MQRQPSNTGTGSIFGKFIACSNLIIITAGVFVYSQQATKHYYEMSPGNNEETTESGWRATATTLATVIGFWVGVWGTTCTLKQSLDKDHVWKSVQKLIRLRMLLKLGIYVTPLVSLCTSPDFNKCGYLLLGHAILICTTWKYICTNGFAVFPELQPEPAAAVQEEDRLRSFMAAGVVEEQGGRGW